MSGEPRIVLVDDHPLLAAGLADGMGKRGIQLDPVIDLTVEGILKAIDDREPDLAVLDYHLPSIGVSEQLFEPLQKRHVPFVVLTGATDELLWGSMLAGGALAVIGKGEPLPVVLDALQDLLSGRPFRPAVMADLKAKWQAQQEIRRHELAPLESLSERERTVLWGLVSGLKANQIAESNFVGVATVRSQMKSIFRKLNVNSQIEAVALVRDLKWQGPDQE